MLLLLSSALALVVAASPETAQNATDLHITYVPDISFLRRYNKTLHAPDATPTVADLISSSAGGPTPLASVASSSPCHYVSGRLPTHCGCTDQASRLGAVVEVRTACLTARTPPAWARPPRHATPRHATPRHATTRPATRHARSATWS